MVDGTGDDLRDRVTALEHWRTQRDIESARHDERWKHMDKRFDELDGKVGEIKGTMTWIARAVGGAILAGVVAFMMRGGFTL